MNKKILIGSILAVALLILVSFSNVVGYNTIKTLQEELIESEFDFEYCKEYLFQTLVDISENSEIKDIIKSNYKPQRNTLLPFRRSNVDLKVEHLELLYDVGLKILDRLGEDKVAELMENIDFDNEMFEEMDTLVMGNEELRERIYTLNTMNVKSETLDSEFPIICNILITSFNIVLIILYLLLFMVELPILYISQIFANNGLINLAYYIVVLGHMIISGMVLIGIVPIFFLIGVFECEKP